MTTTQTPAATVDQVGPDHEPRFELSCWDTEEGDYVHAAMLGLPEALAVAHQLPARLAAVGHTAYVSPILADLAHDVTELQRAQTSLERSATLDGRELAAAAHRGQLEALAAVLELIGSVQR